MEGPLQNPKGKTESVRIYRTIQYHLQSIGSLLFINLIAGQKMNLLHVQNSDTQISRNSLAVSSWK